MAGFLSEIAQWLRFLFSTTQEDKTIVFYAEHRGYHPNYDGLVEALIAKGHKISYFTSDPDDPILNSMDERINPFYFRTLLPFVMVSINCKVFVMTLTELNLHHLKRSVNPVHYVYVFHAMVSTHMMYERHAFDHYDSILCVGPHHEQEIRAFETLESLPHKNLVAAGYSRLEQIHEAYQKHVNREASPTEEPMVLVAPSWGEANVLETCGASLVTALLEAGYEVVVRPHPESLRRTPKVIEVLRRQFENREGFTLETSVATNDSLIGADVLISDCSGIVLEYGFGTLRPTLFIDVPVKVKNKEFGQLGIQPLELALRDVMGVVVSPSDVQTVPGVVATLIAQKDDYRRTLEKLREQYVYNFGHSSQVGAAYIDSLVKSSVAR